MCIRDSFWIVPSQALISSQSRNEPAADKMVYGIAPSASGTWAHFSSFDPRERSVAVMISFSLARVMAT